MSNSFIIYGNNNFFKDQDLNASVKKNIIQILASNALTESIGKGGFKSNIENNLTPEVLNFLSEQLQETQVAYRMEDVHPYQEKPITVKIAIIEPSDSLDVLFEKATRHTINVPFPEPSGFPDTIESENGTAYRANHGTCHAYRQAKLMAIILSEASNEGIFNPHELDLLKMAAFFLRSGRVNELPHHQDDYALRSAQIFQYYAEQKYPSESAFIQEVCNLLKETGKPKDAIQIQDRPSNEKQERILDFLNSVHAIEWMRCFSQETYTKKFDDTVFPVLCKYGLVLDYKAIEKQLLQLTGEASFKERNRLGKREYSQDFVTKSSNPSLCHDACNQVVLVEGDGPLIQEYQSLMQMFETSGLFVRVERRKLNKKRDKYVEGRPFPVSYIKKTPDSSRTSLPLYGDTMYAPDYKHSNGVILAENKLKVLVAKKSSLHSSHLVPKEGKSELERVGDECGPDQDRIDQYVKEGVFDYLGDERVTVCSLEELKAKIQELQEQDDNALTTKHQMRAILDLTTFKTALTQLVQFWSSNDENDISEQASFLVALEKVFKDQRIRIESNSELASHKKIIFNYTLKKLKRRLELSLNNIQYMLPIVDVFFNSPPKKSNSNVFNPLTHYPTEVLCRTRAGDSCIKGIIVRDFSEHEIKEAVELHDEFKEKGICLPIMTYDFRSQSLLPVDMDSLRATIYDGSSSGPESELEYTGLAT